MTPDLIDCVDRQLAAERAGDAAAALEWHQSVPMFRKGRHRSILARLADLGEELPEWVWARWIAYQAIRCEDGATGRLVKECLHVATEVLHGDLLADCFRREDDPVRVLASVLGESWAFHQLVSEVGAAGLFLEEFATGRLAEHEQLSRCWGAARLSGYELGEQLPGTCLRVREADGGGAWLDVLDLGARACAPDGWVLGRLVPSGEDGRLMFDMPPLAVPREIAREVATRPDGDWCAILATAVARGMPSERFMREDYELATDVPELELLRFGTPPRDLARVMEQHRSGRDEVSRAAHRLLESARRGDVAAADHPYVAAAVLNVRGFDDARRNTLRANEPDFWGHWAERVVDPARGRLLELAGLGEEAA